MYSRIPVEAPAKPKAETLPPRAMELPKHTKVEVPKAQAVEAPKGSYERANHHSLLVVETAKAAKVEVPKPQVVEAPKGLYGDCLTLTLLAPVQTEVPKEGGEPLKRKPLQPVSILIL